MMYAIRNKKTKKWLYGTDRRYHPWRQRTSEDMVLIFAGFDHAKAEFMLRRCGKSYEIVPVKVEAIERNNNDINPKN